MQWHSISEGGGLPGNMEAPCLRAWACCIIILGSDYMPLLQYPSQCGPQNLNSEGMRILSKMETTPTLLTIGIYYDTIFHENAITV